MKLRVSDEHAHIASHWACPRLPVADRPSMHPHSIHIFAAPSPTNHLPPGAITIFPAPRLLFSLVPLLLIFPHQLFRGQRVGLTSEIASHTPGCLSYQIIISPAQSSLAGHVACGSLTALRRHPILGADPLLHRHPNPGANSAIPKNVSVKAYYSCVLRSQHRQRSLALIPRTAAR